MTTREIEKIDSKVAALIERIEDNTNRLKLWMPGTYFESAEIPDEFQQVCKKAVVDAIKSAFADGVRVEGHKLEDHFRTLNRK